MLVQISDKEQDRIKSASDYYHEQGLTVEVSNLEIGDYIFSNNEDRVVFEFKTIPDYISSINDGRLWNEAINQAETFNYHFIMIYGDLYQRTKAIIKSKEYVPMTIEQYIGSISSLNRYTTVLQCYNHVIQEAYYTMMKQAEKCLGNRPIVRKFPKKHRNPALNYLQYCIYGLNHKRANDIVTELELKTLEDLLYLDHAKLTSVEGIGPKLASRILETISNDTYES